MKNKSFSFSECESVKTIIQIQVENLISVWEVNDCLLFSIGFKYYPSRVDTLVLLGLYHVKVNISAIVEWKQIAAISQWHCWTQGGCTSEVHSGKKAELRAIWRMKHQAENFTDVNVTLVFKVLNHDCSFLSFLKYVNTFLKDMHQNLLKTLNLIKRSWRSWMKILLRKYNLAGMMYVDGVENSTTN